MVPDVDENGVLNVAAKEIGKHGRVKSLEGKK